MPLEVLRGWASGTESAVDSRRQVGSERVCVKLSCCLDVPYSLVGWWERVVVGLGRELGLLLCCEFLGCLTSLQSSPPPCSHTSWQHRHCLLATGFWGSHGPHHAARGMHAHHPPPAESPSPRQQQTGVCRPEFMAGQPISLCLSRSQGEAI